MSPSHADEEFIRLGVQYYTAARSAWRAGLESVVGNLYHHAIEMLLKAGLSQTRSLADLRKPPFRHSLRGLWDAFKTDFPTQGLNQFDSTVDDIDKFEEIRYPDQTIKAGVQIHIILASKHVSTSTLKRGLTPPPKYKFVVREIDRLVERIFAVIARNPKFFTNGMNKYARAAIKRDNPVHVRLVRQQKRQSKRA